MTPDDTPGATSLRARMDQPLIAIPVVRDGREEVLYFVNEAERGAGWQQFRAAGSRPRRRLERPRRRRHARRA